MGIDIYLNWTGKTEAEDKAQYTGFDVTKGFTGYLREAYHGGPYATKILVPEAFSHRCKPECNEDYKGEPITAATMKARLPEVLEAVAERERILYGGNENDIKIVQKSYRDFVSLAEKKETETGEPCLVYASY